MTTFAPGDILGFSGSGLTSAFINLVTFGAPHYSLSHVGIVARIDGRLMLVESTIETGVQAVPIRRTIQDYIGRAFHYPLSRPLYAHEENRLSDFLTDQIGKRYDYLGATKAGGFLLAKSKAKSTKPQLNTFFCSELCSAAHSMCGLFPTPNPGRWSPNSLCRAERRRGILQAPIRLK